MGDQWMEGERMTSSKRCRSGKLQEGSRDVSYPGGGKEDKEEEGEEKREKMRRRKRKQTRREEEEEEETADYYYVLLLLRSRTSRSVPPNPPAGITVLYCMVIRSFCLQ